MYVQYCILDECIRLFRKDVVSSLYYVRMYIHSPDTDFSTTYPPLLAKFIFPSHMAVVLLWSVPTFVADDIDGFLISVVMVTSRGPKRIQRTTAGKRARAYGLYFPERGASYQVTVYMTMNGSRSRPLNVEVDF